MCIDHFSEVRQMQLTIDSFIGMHFYVNPFKGESVKLEYDKDAFDVSIRKEIHPDEDDQLEFYDLIAKKEGHHIIKAGIQLGSGGYYDTKKYEIEVVTDKSSCV